MNRLTNPMINLGIVEDDLSIRSTLIKYFEYSDEIKVHFDCESADQALSNIKAFPKVDCLLLDIGLPGMSGLDAIPLFKKINQDLDIVIFSSYEEESKILKALCLGACSYISKREGLAVILKALQLVKSGGSYMSPTIAREIANYFLTGKKSQPKINLTNRQSEIISLMVDGKTYSSIAKDLFISIDTVRYHIKQIYQTLHVNNKAEAISYYLNHIG